MISQRTDAPHRPSSPYSGMIMQTNRLIEPK